MLSAQAKTKCCRLKPENVFLLLINNYSAESNGAVLRLQQSWSGNGGTQRAVSAGSRQMTREKPLATSVANKDLVELELRTYLILPTYTFFEMLKHHERNNM